MDQSMIKRGLTITEIAYIHHKCASELEWPDDIRSPLERMAIIAVEVGKAANQCLGDEPANCLGRKLAKIILATLNLAKEKQIDMDYEIVSVMLSNAADVNLKNKSK